MKIYFPSYYPKFKCIADKCKNSCCIGWEIDVDDVTMDKYRRLGGKLGDEVRTRVCSDGVIEMCDNGRCPFLDDTGLCRIISTIGEGYISDICREHPRFYYRVGDRIFGGIGLSCEEAARIILSSDDHAEFIELEHSAESPVETEFDTLEERDFLFSLLSDKSTPYGDRIEAIRHRYNLPNVLDEACEWNKALSELEYLDESRVGQISVGRENRAEGMTDYFVRFLAYLIFRHVSVAESYENLRARVGFCLLLLAVLENMTADIEISLEKISDTARIISEEIEYSEDNTDSLIFEFESRI